MKLVTNAFNKLQSNRIFFKKKLLIVHLHSKHILHIPIQHDVTFVNNFQLLTVVFSIAKKGENIATK